MSHDVAIRPDHSPLVPPGGIECLVRDMTAIVSADVILATAQTELARHDQWLPIDGDPAQTLGRLVETNSTGPLRLGYGAWRDLLLGVQFNNGRGELITAGGRTVKNVAGYDLTKFMVGQRGVFGKLVTITTRTYRRPEAALLARFDASDCTINDLLPIPARPQWALLTPTELLCGYLGDARTIDYYAKILPEHHPIDVVRRTVEEDIDDRRQHWTSPRGPLHLRAAVPPSRIRQFVRDANLTDWIADAAFGIVLSSIETRDAAGPIQAAAASVGGTITVSSEESGLIDLPANPVERTVLERLKQSFDPDGTLAPLPWTSPLNNQRGGN